MKKDKNPLADAAGLRRRAEARLRASKNEAASPTETETLRLLHELQVHQSSWSCKTRNYVSRGRKWKRGWSATPTSTILPRWAT